MNSYISEIPKLFAFDLDGTILNSKKAISHENMDALKQIAHTGALIVFASGRIKGSIFKYISQCSFPVAIVSLNGASVYMDKRYKYKKVYSSTLNHSYADTLIDHSLKNHITLNYYLNNTLYSTLSDYSDKWIDLYIQQTSSEYHYIYSLHSLKGISPSKIIMISDSKILDLQQEYFSSLWKNDIYICRTWDYYLEFLNKKANKGFGIEAIAKAYDIHPKNVIAFGDAENDIPMFEKAGMSIAVQNSNNSVKSAAKYVSKWNNDQNIIAEEWKKIKSLIP